MSLFAISQNSLLCMCLLVKSSLENLNFGERLGGIGVIGGMEGLGGGLVAWEIYGASNWKSEGKT